MYVFITFVKHLILYVFVEIITIITYMEFIYLNEILTYRAFSAKDRLCKTRLFLWFIKNSERFQISAHVHLWYYLKPTNVLLVLAANVGVKIG